MDGQAPNLKLETVLQRVSESLDALAEAVHDVEQAIGMEFSGAGELAIESITRLQSLDRIRQTLEDLAILSLALSQDAEGIVRPGHSDKLRLEATRELLFLKAERADLSADLGASLGQVDLF